MRVKICYRHCSGSWEGEQEWEATAPTLEEAVAACQQKVLASVDPAFARRHLPTDFNWPNRVSLGDNTLLVMYDATNWCY